MLLGGNDVRGGGGDDCHGRHCAPRHRPHPLCLPGPPFTTTASSHLIFPFFFWHFSFSNSYATCQNVVCFQTKIDFTMCGGILFCVLFVFILFGLLMAILPLMGVNIELLHLVYCGIGVLIFSIYLIYDTQVHSFFVFRVNKLNQFLSDDRRRKIIKRRR